MTWIQTHSGKRFDLLEPTPEMVNIHDIAHALSNLCRFNGHVRQFYSVAQHSVLVSNLVGDEYALCALLHDATEAYVGDVTRPLKQLLPSYSDIEQRVWIAVADKFRLPHDLPMCVKHADNIALVTERRDCLMPCEHRWDGSLDAVPLRPEPIRALPPTLAREAFIKRYADILSVPQRTYA